MRLPVSTTSVITPQTKTQLNFQNIPRSKMLRQKTYAQYITQLCKERIGTVDNCVPGEVRCARGWVRGVTDV